MYRIQPDNVHNNIFTPREYQVDLLWQCLQRNTISVLPSSTTKLFLATSLAREAHYLASFATTDEDGAQPIRLVYIGHCVNTLQRIADSIKQNTALSVSVLPSTEAELTSWDEDEWKINCHLSQVVVVTTSVACSFTSKLKVEAANLLFITDAQQCLTDASFRKLVQSVPSYCRVVGCTPPLLSKTSSHPPHIIHSFLKRLRLATGCDVTTASDVVALIGNDNRATECVTVCSPPSSVYPAVEERVREILGQARLFLNEHRYDPIEIYGEGYREFLAGVPDPKMQPIKILTNFENVLNDMGLWSADRAALYALVEVERLKKKTAYDRHFLLLCMIFTLMAKIRTVIGEEFDEHPELEQILKFSTPKVLRLIEILRRLRPIHFVDPRRRNRDRNQQDEEQDEESSSGCHSPVEGSQPNSCNPLDVIEVHQPDNSSADCKPVVVETLYEGYRFDHIHGDAKVTEVTDDDIERLHKEGWFGDHPGAADITSEDPSSPSDVNHGADNYNDHFDQSAVPGSNRLLRVRRASDELDGESVESFQSCQERMSELMLDDSGKNGASNCNHGIVASGNHVQTVNSDNNDSEEPPLTNGSVPSGCEVYKHNCFKVPKTAISRRVKRDSTSEGIGTPEIFSSCSASPLKQRTVKDALGVALGETKENINEEKLSDLFAQKLAVNHNSANESQIEKSECNSKMAVKDNVVLLSNGHHNDLFISSANSVNSFDVSNNVEHSNSTFLATSLSDNISGPSEELSKNSSSTCASIMTQQNISNHCGDNKICDHFDTVKNISASVQKQYNDYTEVNINKELQSEVQIISVKDNSSERLMHVDPCETECQTANAYNQSENQIQTDSRKPDIKEGEAENEIQPDAGNEVQPDAGNELHPGAGNELQPDAGNELQPGAENEVQSGAGNEAQPGAGNEAQPDAGNEVQPDAGNEVQPDAGNEVQPGIIREIQSNYHRRGGKRRTDIEVKEKTKVYNPDDPDSVCGLIFVRDSITAKMVYRLLKELSDIGGDFSWVFPQYTVEINTDPGLEEKVIEAEQKKQEEVLRRFRFFECNLLVTTKVLEHGIDVPLCTLVIRYDPPSCFQSYVHSCGRARPSRNSHLVHVLDSKNCDEFVKDLASYTAYNKVLLENCDGKKGDSVALGVRNCHVDISSDVPTLDHSNDVQVDPNDPNSHNLNLNRKASAMLELADEACSPYVTCTGTKLSLSQAMQLLNKYCAKLPSDSFTRLTVQWQLHSRNNYHCCTLALPINSPLKDVIVGPWNVSPVLAKHSAAFLCCIVLHQMGELDNNLLPVGKESIHIEQHICPPPPTDCQPDRFPRPGTTKRRQYYYKKVAKCLIGGCRAALTDGSVSKAEDDIIYKSPSPPTVVKLYSINMVLRCAIPDQQNTRGRRIYRPELSLKDFGLLTTHDIPSTSSFPVFTRSGEVMVQLDPISSSLECKNLRLSSEQLQQLNNFHQFTFTHVLRLEKYPIKFDPLKAHTSYFVVPLIRESEKLQTIDWEFVNKIYDTQDPRPSPPTPEEREKFNFSRELYEDAVVMPWYRNHDQPQYFYVAEICDHLTPQSDFPDAGFETFEKYYLTKYGLQVCNLTQPLLDVDHTSARLNLLTPRHVNRKGVALPTTSEETKKAKRENLQQKQILVPELCSIHPFPASLWRKAVCLPTVLYRINCLLLADELRVKVAQEIGLGQPHLPYDHAWPALDFGWTLADVFKKSMEEENAVKAKAVTTKTGDNDSSQKTSKENKPEETRSSDVEENSNKEDSKNSKNKAKSKAHKELEIGTWTNDMAFENTNEFAADLEDDELDELDIFDPDIELPDNITMLDGMAADDEVEGELGADWGTGLKERKAKTRVSAPNAGSRKAPSTSNPVRFNKLGGGSSSTETYSGGMFRVGSPSNFESEDVYDYNGGDGLSDGKAMDSIYDYDDYNDDNDDDYDYWDEDYESSSEDESPADTSTHSQNNEWATKNKRKTGNEDNDESEEEEELDLLMGEVDEEELKTLELHYANIIKERQLEIINDESYVKEDEELRMVKPCRANWPPKVEDSGNKTDASDSNKDDRSGNLEGKQKQNNIIDKEKMAHVPINIDESLSCQTFGVDYSSIDHQSTLKALTVSYCNRDSIVLYPVGEERKLFSFDHQPELESHTGPSPSIILQALTMSNANDGVNLERLETIGDSYLKYAITTYLYCSFSHQHEGKLSYLRSKQVSNLNLYRLGKYKGMGECMVATKFEPHDNWLPPSYYVPRELEEALIASGIPSGHWNMADLPNLHELSSDQIKSMVAEKSKRIRKTSTDTHDLDGMPSYISATNPEELPIFIPYNLLTQHSIPDKSIADAVEALIGAYLTTCGPKGALLFMSWLGIKVLPTVTTLDTKTGRQLITFTQVDAPKSPLHIPKVVCAKDVKFPLSSAMSTADNQLECLFNGMSSVGSPIILPNAYEELNLMLTGYDKFESIINYEFKDRSYLLQAFTHASFCRNRLTDCYQRLEFLGDAVLDYVITRHLYEDCRQHSPGALTDLRSALVNNTIFATLAVKYSFHKYFRHFSPGLDGVIREFVKDQEANGHKINEEYYLLEGEIEADIVEDIEVPKALGDVFESIAGAIFLDSGFSLDAVWSVYYPMMKDAINQFTAVVPKSPIRELLEMEPETARFGRPERLVDGKVRVSVEIFGKGTFCGVGRNYRIAKSTAAKRALRHIRRATDIA